MARNLFNIGQCAAAGRTVLVVAPAFPPSTAAGVHRTVRFVRMLPEFGWRPVVLTTTADEPGAVPDWLNHVRVERSLRWREKPETTRSMQSTTRAELPEGEAGEVQTRAGTRNALKQMFRNARSLLLETPDREVNWALPARSIARRLAAEESADAVYTSGPPHSAHLIGMNLKRQQGLPWVADFRDPWARKPWGHKARNPWGQRLLGLFERRCVEAADVVVLNTSHMATEFRQYYRSQSPDKFIAIPNGCDPALLERANSLIETAASDRSHAGSPNTFRLCHVGSLYSRRDPRPIIDALLLLRKEGCSVTFEQVGGCKAEFRLQEYAGQRDVADLVRCEPPVPHDEALRRMAGADALLLIQPGTETQVPGKLFEMLAFRKPILALADEGATSEIIERYRLGQVVRSDDASNIASAIRSFMDDTDNKATTGDWAAACHDFDGRKLTGRLAEQLNAICGERCATVLGLPVQHAAPIEAAAH